MPELVFERGTVEFDEEDAERILSRSWYINKRGYVVSSNRNPELGPAKIRLQRFIMKDVPDDRVVDHRDGNRLNNRRKNLRICDYGENARNRKNHTGSSSQYKGVTFRKARGKWRAYLQSHGKRYLDKLFVDEIEAAKAYDAVAKEVYGEYAKLNFPN